MRPPSSHALFRLYWLTAIVCCGGLLFGYDSGVIGGVLTFDSFHRSFRYTSKNETRVSAIAVGVQQAGALVGSLLIWPLTNRLGRRPAMAICSFIFCIGVIFEVLDSHARSVFYIGRVICGLGIGGSATVIPIYLTEMSPTSMRARLGSCYQFSFTIGILISYWIDYGMQYATPTAAQWQIPLALQLIPGALMGAGMLTLHESVRWLLSHDRTSAAWDSLAWIRASRGAEVKAEFRAMQSAIERDAHATTNFSPRELLQRSNAHRLGLGVSLFVCQQSTGATAMAYFGPQFFSLLVGGSSDASTTSESTARLTLLLTGIFGFLKVVSCLVFVIFVADRFGRRPLLVAGALAMSVCMLATAAVLRGTASPDAEAGSLSPAAVFTVALIYLSIVAYNLSWGPLPWPCSAELFSSARIREPGVAMGVAAQWLSNFGWSFATPYLLQGLGWGTFALFGVLDAGFAGFVYGVLPETRGMRLEEIDSLFDGGR
ncbi:sugar porter family MFS transporter [Aspergillus saccharolyticus JOP 1030-1]|uniref:General substrate transporter n=1 Tax=Aspergillus saccharolyticus JOP 1030-1 TaxID=1450539 RepID=A0A318Z8W9_9EURO|nr:general substrate transporter [Aspergillus saccharolyticus JOP 1030-1]PYH43801.1 general substrate transporter [Aspergillus saccharolyticus JOP 1030-1]